MLIDRNAAEADIQVQQTAANELRSMLGLPVIGSDLQIEQGPVWLHRIALDDAIAAGSQQYDGRGCMKPEAAEAAAD